MLPRRWLADEPAVPLPVGLQLAEHVMNEFRNLILVERVAMHRLLPDRAICQPFRRLLHEVKNHRAFTEANVFVTDFGRSPAPRFPASIRATNEPRVSPRVDALHRDVMPPNRYVIIHQEIRSLRVAHLPQSLRRKRLLDRRADALANNFIIGAGFARDGFSP